MMYNGIEYNIGADNVHVCNSYVITNDEAKRVFIRHLLETVDGLKRSEKSLFNEWKGHNVFYQRGWWKNHTADVDFEFKQNFVLKIIWCVVSHIFKEKTL